jgi:hypothetical protein
MNSNKCPKCGFITMATATVCKNCMRSLTAANETTNQSKEPQSWIDTFCVLNLLAGSILSGIIFCLYWDMYVLSKVLPSGRYPVILLILLYVPAGILAIICGALWFGLLRFIFKTMGFKLSEA